MSWNRPLLLLAQNCNPTKPSRICYLLASKRWLLSWGEPYTGKNNTYPWDAPQWPHSGEKASLFTNATCPCWPLFLYTLINHVAPATHYWTNVDTMSTQPILCGIPPEHAYSTLKQQDCWILQLSFVQFSLSAKWYTLPFPSPQQLVIYEYQTGMVAQILQVDVWSRVAKPARVLHPHVECCYSI